MSIGTPVNLGGPAFTSGNGVTTSFTMLTSANIASGDMPVVAVVFADGGANLSVASVSDGTNTYSKAAAFYSTTASNVDEELWYCANAAAVASGATITVTLSAALPSGGFLIAISAATVSGVAASMPVDQSAHADSAGATNVTMTTAGLALAPEIAFGVAFSASSLSLTETQQGSWANLNHGVSALGIYMTFDYVTLAGTGSVTFNPTFNQSHAMSGLEATFKGAVAFVQIPYQPWCQLGPLLAQCEALGRSFSGWRKRRGLFVPAWEF